MSQVLFELFLADNLKLARTLVIKSSASADTLNKRIEGIGRVVDYNDETTWKYYKNLAGEYHELDELMTVKSLDTLTEIDFTKENLLVHRATAKAYAYGTPYYQALVTKFPKQEQLINGILNPVDIYKAISAKNHTILWYDPTLVEANESNLISKLQLAIDAWWRRNDSPAYDYTHDLYTASLYASFFGAVNQMLLGIRLENCHTANAHSFHIWSYLAGKGHLDEFKDYLTIEQTLWLYRNIDYLTSTLGQTAARELLIQRLLTDRGFPIVRYDLFQNTAEMPDSLVPTVDVVATPLNFQDKLPLERDTTTVRDVVEKENPLARENPDYMESQIESVESAVKYSAVTNTPTRVMECKVVDRSESKHIRLSDVLLNHWLYLSQSRRYNSILTLADPQTGDAFNISTKDAFVLWVWLVNRAMNWTLNEPPLMIASRVRRLAYPTKESLRKLADPKYVPDWLINLFYEKQPPIGLVVSTEAFNELCHEIYQGDLYQYKLCTDQQNFLSRAQAELINLAFYQDVTFQLAPEGMTYSQWFKERGFNFESLSTFDCNVLAGQILDKATGADLSKQYTLKEIQTAMLSLFKRLSSYTTQVIQSISASPLALVGCPLVRLGEDRSLDVAHDKIQINLTTILDDRSKDLESVDSSLFGTHAWTANAKDLSSYNLGNSLEIEAIGPGRDRDKIKMSVVTFRERGE